MKHNLIKINASEIKPGDGLIYDMDLISRVRVRRDEVLVWCDDDTEGPWDVFPPLAEVTVLRRYDRVEALERALDWSLKTIDKQCGPITVDWPEYDNARSLVKE